MAHRYDVGSWVQLTERPELGSGQVLSSEQGGVAVSVRFGTEEVLAPADALRPHIFAKGDMVRCPSLHVQGVVVAHRRLTSRTYYDIFLPVGLRTIAESDLEPVRSLLPIARLIRGDRDTLADYALRASAIHLGLAYAHNPYASLSSSRLEPKPYQVFVAHRVTGQYYPRFILADEVGLGKTVEAGMILKEMRARQLVRRVLVVAPANLVTQWQWELENKFNEKFIIYDRETMQYLQRQSQEENPWLAHDRIICSLHFARQDERMLEISEAPWDLVIFDEAHHLRQHKESGNRVRKTKAYHLASALATRVEAMLFLTATPMQLHSFELFSLVHLLAPDRFPDFDDFERYRLTIPELNRWASQVDRADQIPGPERERLAEELMHANLALTAIRGPRELAAALATNVEVREEVSGLIHDRHRLTHVMIRNRKRNLDGFVERAAKTISIQLTPYETEVYAEIEQYVQWAYRQAKDARNTALGWTMMVFQKLLTSSSHALAESIRKRIDSLKREQSGSTVDPEEYSDEEWDRVFEATVGARGLPYELSNMERFLAKVQRIGVDSKLRHLEALLEDILAGDPSEKVLIFTQFTRTMEYLAARLRTGHKVATFHGGMSRDAKDEAIKRFKQDAQILISTEAGGEGRNLQFCHFVVNYDLPWNPMKVEQRIGRLDRIGQKRRVFVISFTVAGTVEERIYQVLNDRLQLFENTVGNLDPILGDLEDDIRRIILEHGHDFHREVERLDRALAERMQETQQAEQMLGDFIMDARSFRRDAANALLGRTDIESWRDLEEFMVGMVAHYPGGRFDVDPRGLATIELPAALRQAIQLHRLDTSYRGTFNPDLAKDDESLPFFAFGHELIDGLVAFAGGEETEFPGRVAAFEANLDGLEQQTRGLLMHYLVEYTGVRPRKEVVTVGVDWDGRSLEKPEQLLRAPSLREWLDPDISMQDADHLQFLERLGAEELDRRMTQRREALQEENLKALISLRSRLERFHQAKQALLLRRLENESELVQEKEVSDAPGDKRILPALRGRLERARRELAEMHLLFQEKIAELEEKQRVSCTSRLMLASLFRNRAIP